MRRLAHTAALALAGAVLGAGTASGAPLVDHTGAPIPRTEAAGRAGDLVNPFQVVAGASQVFARPSILRPLGTPDAAPQPSGSGSPLSPEEDLANALGALAAAATPADVTAARQKALDVLEGNTGAGGACPPSLASPPRAYCGIPLLNWQPTTKLQTVPAGGTVTVRVIRFGQHQLTDTSLLTFADPNQPFSIVYEISELGGSDGGDLMPTPILADAGGPVGGMHSAIVSLAQREIPLGTTQQSRFTNRLSIGAQPEHTSIVTQTVEIAMPPPRYVTAILDPNLRAGNESLATMLPANAARTAGLAATVATGAAKLSDASPEKQIWNALNALPGSVAGANAVGAQLRTTVMPVMRVRNLLPPGVAPLPGAAVTVAVQNGETYVSRTRINVPPGGSTAVGITNRDAVARTFRLAVLFNRRFAQGAIPWGQFDWKDASAAVTVPAGGSTVVPLTSLGDGFALWVGDDNVGDQSGTVIGLDREAVIEAFKIPPPNPASAAPLHVATDSLGRAYVTLAGIDKIVRITPGLGDTLSNATYEEFLIPQQNCLPPPPDAPLAPCGPGDLGIDRNGIIFATLGAGSAILRFDPTQGRPGTTGGMTVYPLAPCNDVICHPPPPPALPGPISRTPVQMDLTEDAQGNTVAWFSELDADAIGMVRVGPGGALLGAADFPCGCAVLSVAGPEADPGVRPVGGLSGIAIDSAKRVWFTEGAAGKVGRITPNPANPASTPVIEHFDLPSHPPTQDFDLGPGLFNTSFPHSVTIDGQGKVWVTEQQPSITPPSGVVLTKIAVLDPATAVPNTTAGVIELPIPRNDFGQLVQVADLTADDAGNIFVADEYGDQITVVRFGQGVVGRWRSVRRQSLTDQPIADVKGNLWYLEVAANLVVRIKGVTAGPIGTAKPPPPLTALQRACASRHFMYGTKAKPKVLLLKMTQAQVRTCLGSPTKRLGKGAKQRWRYGKQVEIRFTGSRVSGFTLLNKTYRTSFSGLGVGSTTATLARSRPKATLSKGTARYRTVVALGAGKFAEITYLTARKRVSRVVVEVRTRAQLKRAPTASTASLPAGHTSPGDAVTSLVSFRAASLGYAVRFAGPRVHVRAETDTAARTITVFTRPGDVPSLTAHDLAHEIGHAFDASRMSDAERRAYLATRGVPDARWWPAADADYDSGAGDFAEVFALCHAPNATFRSTLAGRPEDPCSLLPKDARQ